MKNSFLDFVHLAAGVPIENPHRSKLAPSGHRRCANHMCN
uniref:Transposase n=1 Tax=Bursaphelenchus xylophilus TaxID=6326 RepID=A0A1I7SDN7_BURXY